MCDEGKPWCDGVCFVCAVSVNKIGDQGAIALAPAVARLTNLTELSLGGKLCLCCPRCGCGAWRLRVRARVRARVRVREYHTRPIWPLFSAGPFWASTAKNFSTLTPAGWDGEWVGGWVVDDGW